MDPDSKIFVAGMTNPVSANLVCRPTAGYCEQPLIARRRKLKLVPEPSDHFNAQRPDDICLATTSVGSTSGNGTYRADLTHAHPTSRGTQLRVAAVRPPATRSMHRRCPSLGHLKPGISGILAPESPPSDRGRTTAATTQPPPIIREAGGTQQRGASRLGAQPTRIHVGSTS